MNVARMGMRVVVAARPVDFRKVHDGLAAVVEHELGLNPYSGVAVAFRPKRASASWRSTTDGRTSNECVSDDPASVAVGKLPLSAGVADHAQGLGREVALNIVIDGSATTALERAGSQLAVRPNRPLEQRGAVNCITPGSPPTGVQASLVEIAHHDQPLRGLNPVRRATIVVGVATLTAAVRA